MARRRASEAALPEDFRNDYLRIARIHGEEALATVDGDICQGCFQTITPQMCDQLRCGKPIFCMTCGRLLYLPEKTSLVD